MKRCAIILLLLTACASSKKPVVPPKPITELPASALDVLCTELRAEGMTSELRVVKQTQPIVTGGSLRSLAEASFGSAGKVNPDAIQKILVTPLIPLEIPQRSCVTRFVTAAEADRVHDVMVAEFSSPFPNPFGRGQTGTMVRLTLGGEVSTAMWYWIPLMYYNDRWLAGNPSTLSVIE